MKNNVLYCKFVLKDFGFPLKKYLESLEKEPVEDWCKFAIATKYYLKPMYSCVVILKLHNRIKKRQ